MIEAGQVRAYMQPLVEGEPSTPMVVVHVTETEVHARPAGHPGPEYLTYRREDFERWYPRVVA